MQESFSKLLEEMHSNIDVVKYQLDNAMLQAEDTIDKVELDKLRNLSDKLDLALKNKDIESLNQILKDANKTK